MSGACRTTPSTRHSSGSNSGCGAFLSVGGISFCRATSCHSWGLCWQPPGAAVEEPKDVFFRYLLKSVGRQWVQAWHPNPVSRWNPRLNPTTSSNAALCMFICLSDISGKVLQSGVSWEQRKSRAVLTRRERPTTKASAWTFLKYTKSNSLLLVQHYIPARVAKWAAGASPASSSKPPVPWRTQAANAPQGCSPSSKGAT